MGIVASLIWRGYGRYDKWFYSAFARSERRFGGWTQQLAVVAAAVGSVRDSGMYVSTVLR